MIKYPDLNKAKRLTLGETIKSLRGAIAWGEDNLTDLEAGVILRVVHALEEREAKAIAQDLKKTFSKNKGFENESIETKEPSPAEWDKREEEYREFQ